MDTLSAGSSSAKGPEPLDANNTRDGNAAQRILRFGTGVLSRAPLLTLSGRMGQDILSRSCRVSSAAGRSIPVEGST
jgi:hypothetical protein